MCVLYLSLFLSGATAQASACYRPRRLVRGAAALRALRRLRVRGAAAPHGREWRGEARRHKIDHNVRRWIACH